MWTIEYEQTQMVSRHAGSLPVLLTCSHGGTAKPPGVSQRTGSTPDCPPFKISSDRFTKEITIAVAQLMLETLGEAPYVVIAEYHRKYIDANRSEHCAFEQPAAQPFYAEYHHTIRRFIDAIQSETGLKGFVFDIHGTTTIEEDPADVYIGTDNGDAVRRLLSTDPLAVWGRRSVRGLLQAARYIVSPAQPGIPETPQVDGG
jgi:N-formylglutamate amidohydrolase